MTRKDGTPFRGRWRLVDTDLWDLDDLDLDEQAHITFGSRGLGSLALIAMQADLDYVVGQRDGQPVVEFTWDGIDEGDPICGRGSTGSRSSARSTSTGETTRGSWLGGGVMCSRGPSAGPVGHVGGSLAQTLVHRRAVAVHW
jgi:hypothetical protein